MPPSCVCSANMHIKLASKHTSFCCSLCALLHVMPANVSWRPLHGKSLVRSKGEIECAAFRMLIEVSPCQFPYWLAHTSQTKLWVGTYLPTAFCAPWKFWHGPGLQIKKLKVCFEIKKDPFETSILRENMLWNTYFNSCFRMKEISFQMNVEGL